MADGTHDAQVQWIGRTTVAAAVLGAVLAPLHALARHATADGREDLEAPLTRAWSEPVSEALRPLLDWADPDTVYITYGKGWVFVFGLAALCAFVTRRQRSPYGLERWGWRITLTAYTVMTLGAALCYWTPWWMDTAFLVLALPGLLLTVVGSTTLGIALLKRRFEPRATAWLLVLTLPLLLALGQVVSFGGALMPGVVAWALVGRRMAAGTGAPRPRPSSADGGRRLERGAAPVH